jgi:hypothetical protein
LYGAINEVNKIFKDQLMKKVLLLVVCFNWIFAAFASDATLMVSPGSGKASCFNFACSVLLKPLSTEYPDFADVIITNRSAFETALNIIVTQAPPNGMAIGVLFPPPVGDNIYIQYNPSVPAPSVTPCYVLPAKRLTPGASCSIRFFADEEASSVGPMRLTIQGANTAPIDVTFEVQQQD